MLFIFLIPLKSQIINAVKANIIPMGTAAFKGYRNVIIEKSYNPCKRVAKTRPNMVNLTPLMPLTEDKARKYPTRAEQSVCKKVAPIKRTKLIVIVVLAIAPNEMTLSKGENK